MQRVQSSAEVHLKWSVRGDDDLLRQQHKFSLVDHDLDDDSTLLHPLHLHGGHLPARVATFNPQTGLLYTL
uniref:Uncharacterized protein n=1 Tax=Lutzomyia longipalpis TaxID=7200 RepID=A0A1B0CL00_LUTLO